jgi:cytidylate kinase
MTRPLTIAIDGPAGAGKSTVARQLARRVGYLYIDSGAMYRAVALLAQRMGVPLTEPDQIAALARAARLRFEIGGGSNDEGDDSAGSSDYQRVLLNDEDVTAAIRTPEITALSSAVSAIPGVRSALVLQQQALGARGGVVMEGRDIGTVVFPGADLKVFLTASADERAVRRHKELQTSQNSTSSGGASSVASLDEVRRAQDERDARDSTRSVSPLVPAPDAIHLDSSGRAPDEIVDEIVARMDERGGRDS